MKLCTISKKILVDKVLYIQQYRLTLEDFLMLDTVHITKTYTLRSQKCENKSWEPKNGFWASILVWSCDISSDWKFYIDNENIDNVYMKKIKTFRGQKVENKPSEPKKQIWAP
jgi:hypothetical protein